jgi:hypothetical protein
MGGGNGVSRAGISVGSTQLFVVEVGRVRGDRASAKTTAQHPAQVRFQPAPSVFGEVREISNEGKKVTSLTRDVDVRVLLQVTDRFVRSIQPQHVSLLHPFSPTGHQRFENSRNSALGPWLLQLRRLRPVRARGRSVTNPGWGGSADA